MSLHQPHARNVAIDIAKVLKEERKKKRAKLLREKDKKVDLFCQLLLLTNLLLVTALCGRTVT